MPPRDAARDLLLGLLAFQNHFLDRAGLLGAFDDWNAQPDKTLADILKQRGALTETRLALLTGLVDEHIHQHGDDPHQSLAVVSSIGSLRDELAKLSDTALLASLPIVATLDPYATRTAAGPAPAAPGSRFRVLRFHAKGGLGQVSVAMDDELDREVALKEIQEQHADHPHSRSRFVLEAEITGKLEHPGIIPVYGLGHDVTGRPYYAMRFVRGDSLQDAIKRFHGPDGPRDATARTLALRDLLGRFLDVCDAISYAHSRGVLHRDLKPGNIMLGKFGETLVVDWGLAKPLGAGESADGEASIKPTKADTSGSATQAGVAIGTPAYMSPEQAEGRLDLLGPRSDVYGLGATLYALLSGHAPVGSGDVLRRVARGDIDPLRKHVPAVSRALEAICLKAMAPRPDDRYADARSLAADLKHWLADEPVTARRDPLATRAWRWARKHRTAATAAAAVLLVGSTGLAVAWRREAALGSDLAKALGRELQANGRLIVANEQIAAANTELRLANERVTAAKTLADRRLDDTLAAVKDYYTGVGEEVLLEQPQLVALRNRLLERPRQFYEKLAADLAGIGASDARSRELLAGARVDLGCILAFVGETETTKSEFAAAAAAYERLAAEQPGVPEHRRGLAQCYMNLGNAQFETGATTAAIASYETAIERYERLATENPGAPDYRAGLALSIQNLGVAQRSTGAVAAAIASHEKAIELFERLAAELPGVLEYRVGPAVSYTSLGNVQFETGAAAAAIASHEKAIERYGRLAAEQPSMPVIRRGLAGSYMNLGVAQRSTGAGAAAIASHEKAIELFGRLATEQPGVPEYRRGLANSYMNLGNAQRSTGAAAEAVASHRMALEQFDRLATEQPGVTKNRSDLANSYRNLGIAQRAIGDIAAAITSHEKAIERYGHLAAEQPGVPNYRAGLASSYTNLGNAQDEMGAAAAAIASHEKAVEQLGRLAAEQPSIPAYRNQLAAGYLNLGNAQRASGAATESIASYEAAITALRPLVADHPRVIRYQHILGGSLGELGRTLLGGGHAVEAEAALRESVAVEQAVFLEAPNDPEVRQFLSTSYRLLASALRAEQRGKEASEFAQQFRRLWPRVANEQYNAACELALCVPMVSMPERDAMETEAMEAFRQSIAIGWSDATHTAHDPGLDALRARADFRRLLAEMFDRKFPERVFADEPEGR